MSSLYLKVEHVAGESQDAHHAGWIDVLSHNWGNRRSAADNALVEYRNLTVHALIDKATPTLLLYASNGSRIRKVELSACKAGSGGIEYYRITLENVFVAQVVLNDGDDLGSIEYQFEADTVKMQYWEQTAKGGKGAETRYGWDIKNHHSVF
ncbi:Hcp family type VI secretion system effector [Pantoea sp. FN0302]|uniref:Hcp family type VI secretion system effector n=1 Tax=Pantoea sp. FN0302 TaxID=3418558 RepID=UPI003CFA4898